MSVVIKNAVDLIRSAPDRFFPGGQPTMSHLITRVMRDATELDDIRLTVQRVANRTLITANRDWMSSRHAPFLDLFSTFVMPEYAEPNCARSEVFLVAAGSSIMTVGDMGRFSCGERLDGFVAEFHEGDEPPARLLAWAL